VVVPGEVVVEVVAVEVEVVAVVAVSLAVPTVSSPVHAVRRVRDAAVTRCMRIGASYGLFAALRRAMKTRGPWQKSRGRVRLAAARLAPVR
jgi:hypothetical protein